MAIRYVILRPKPQFFPYFTYSLLFLSYSCASSIDLIIVTNVIKITKTLVSCLHDFPELIFNFLKTIPLQFIFSFTSDTILIFGWIN